MLARHAQPPAAALMRAHTPLASLVMHAPTREPRARFFSARSRALPTASADMRRVTGATAAATPPPPRRPRRRPPPLVVPGGAHATSLPSHCYEPAPPSAPLPVEWRAKGLPHAAATRRGARRRANEDRLFADPAQGLFGVCDGHGGARAAERAAMALQRSAEQLLDHPVDVLARVNADIIGEHAGDYVGTTATIAIARPTEGRLRIIHLGDCRAVVIDAAGVAHALTDDHCPNRDDEGLRIKAAGGAVLNGRVNGVLAVSRALGDPALASVLSARPDVIDRRIGPAHHLLVVGSDGFFDVVADRDLAAALSSMPIHPGTSAVPLDMQAAALQLINLAVARRSTDDISLVLVDLRAQPTVQSQYR